MFIKGHPNGHLRAIVALLLVLAVPSLRVLRTGAFEVSIGDIVEDHASFELEDIELLFTQTRLNASAMLQ